MYISVYACSSVSTHYEYMDHTVCYNTAKITWWGKVPALPT
jgi:hypothetical protein